MSKKRKGRLPTMINAAEFAHLSDKPSSQLAALRADLGSLMHVHGSMVNKYRIEIEGITAILHARERPEFEVSDHAVVRWLQKVKGFDIDALRREIAEEAGAAKRENGGVSCRAKGDAIAYTRNEVTFIVAHRNNIVTVVFGSYENPIPRPLDKWASAEGPSIATNSEPGSAAAPPIPENRR